jgi:hypothetical protein
MDLILGPEIISSYKRLAYEPWYALAEFVDNSTQAYANNKAALDTAYKAEGTVLTVEITCDADGKSPFIRIKDNSIGMSDEDLANAVHIGIKPKDTRGRSKYGLGLKTGASWFGDVWTIETKKLGETRSHKITVDVEKVADGNLKLPHVQKKIPATEHWTIIEIRKLNRKMTNRVLTKTKRFLASVYRKDIQSGDVVLVLNGETLTWDSDFKSKLLTQEDGEKAYHEFKFKVGKHTVSGWAGVLERGSRSEAGFSIFQSKRMIAGWPDSYKPESIYGDQSGGTNDLVNQRLFGELNLDGFGVSHTKDQILFEDDEKESLEHKLAQELGPLRQLARSFRKSDSGALRVASDAQRSAAVNSLEREIESKEMREMLDQLELPSLPVIKRSNDVVRDRVVKTNKPTLETKINKIIVKVYLVKDMSPNDPYVIIESTKLSGPVVVIINLQHPHWYELTNEESVLNFIRHCTYDAVAEFKAYALTGKLEPDTVKLIKDNLLRVPMKLGPV